MSVACYGNVKVVWPSTVAMSSGVREKPNRDWADIYVDGVLVDNALNMCLGGIIKTLKRREFMNFLTCMRYLYITDQIPLGWHQSIVGSLKASALGQSTGCYAVPVLTHYEWEDAYDYAY